MAVFLQAKFKNTVLVHIKKSILYLMSKVQQKNMISQIALVHFSDSPKNKIGYELIDFFTIFSTK